MLALDYNYLVLMGDWAAIYKASPIGSRVRADWFSGSLRAPGDNTGWHPGLGFTCAFTSLENSGDENLVYSTLLLIQPMATGTLLWSGPWFGVEISGGAGLSFARLLAQSGQSMGSVNLNAAEPVVSASITSLGTLAGPFTWEAGLSYSTTVETHAFQTIGFALGVGWLP